MLASIVVGLLLDVDLLKDKTKRKQHMPYEKWHLLMEERLDEWYEWYHREVLKVERNPETGELVDITNSDDEYAMDEDEEDYSFKHQEMQQLIRALGENHSPLKEHMYHTLPIYHRFEQTVSVRPCYHGHAFLSAFLAYSAGCVDIESRSCSASARLLLKEAVQT
eukprot:SAG31_NODE_1156_length_9616_cov_26.963014_9_plen_165_part_00